MDLMTLTRVVPESKVVILYDFFLQGAFYFSKRYAELDLNFFTHHAEIKRIYMHTLVGDMRVGFAPIESFSDRHVGVLVARSCMSRSRPLDSSLQNAGQNRRTGRKRHTNRHDVRFCLRNLRDRCLVLCHNVSFRPPVVRIALFHYFDRVAVAHM